MKNIIKSLGSISLLVLLLACGSSTSTQVVQNPQQPVPPQQPQQQGQQQVQEQDLDMDGVVDSLDCEPLNAFVAPGFSEFAMDGIDQDCANGDLLVKKISALYKRTNLQGILSELNNEVELTRFGKVLRTLNTFNGQTRSLTNTYNELNQLTSSTLEQFGRIVHRTDYLYDDLDRLILENKDDAGNGTIDISKQYFYNEINQVNLIKSFNRGQLESQKSIQYDNKGRIIEENEQILSFDIVELKKIYVYDEEDYLQKYEEKRNGVVEFSYELLKQDSKVVFSDRDTTTTSFFDEQKRLVRRTVDEVQGIDTNHDYEYIVNGSIIEQKLIARNQRIITNTYATGLNNSQLNFYQLMDELLLSDGKNDSKLPKDAYSIQAYYQQFPNAFLLNIENLDQDLVIFSQRMRLNDKLLIDSVNVENQNGQVETLFNYETY